MPRRPRYDNRIDGFLVVDKPVGVSSAKVVAWVRRAAGNCKTGHAGTLDPLASGVLVCCLGHATKAVDQLMASRKTYETVVDFSSVSASGDAEGPLEPIGESSLRTVPGLKALREACERWTGEVEQRPPAFSAVHVNGKRAYALARAGEEIALPARQVRIDSIDILDFTWPRARLRVSCGKGVYIRSLGRDLGAAMGVGGYLAELRRTRVEPFGLDEAWTGEQIQQGVTQADLIPVDQLANNKYA